MSVNCLHPGAVATQLGINRETGFGKLITGLLKPFFQTPAQGAETLIYLATHNENPKLIGQACLQNIATLHYALHFLLILHCTLACCLLKVFGE